MASTSQPIEGRDGVLSSLGPCQGYLWHSTPLVPMPSSSLGFVYVLLLGEDELLTRVGQDTVTNDQD